MNIDDFENNLGSIPVDQSKVFTEILRLLTYNNALLESLIAIKANEYHQIDPSKSIDQYESELLKVADGAAQSKYAKILLKLSE